MIELHDVWKSERKGALKDRWTLEGVDLVIPPGRRIALLGSEPAQNSTLLRLLAGVEQPERGAIRRVGRPCWPLDFMGAMEMRATFIQNARFLAQVYGVDEAQVADIAAQLSRVRLVRGKPMNQYLALDRKALALGLTLSLQFDWYFLDEKLPKVTEDATEIIHAALHDRLSRASVVWAATAPEALNGYCDAGLVLDQGSLTFYDSFGEAVEAFHGSNEPRVVKDNDRKSRKIRRRRRAARREGALDPQNPV